MHFDNAVTSRIPIPKKSEILAEQLEAKEPLQAQLGMMQTDFLNLLTDNFEKLTVNKAVENWHQSDFISFKKVLEKQKIEIPLKKQKEWREMFESEKTHYLSLQTQIALTEKEIDTLVYALYELTDEAIQIIENQ
jgi:hypothetical protein